MIAIPLFADQVFNAGSFERNKAGIMVPKTEMNGDTISAALTKVLDDDSYCKNAKKMARMIQLYPENPSETFVKSVEYSAEFPELGEQLQLFGVNLSTFVYYSLDVISFIVVCTLITVLSVLYITGKVLTVLFQKRTKQE